MLKRTDEQFNERRGLDARCSLCLYSQHVDPEPLTAVVERPAPGVPP
jgi:hypothetical protein